MNNWAFDNTQQNFKYMSNVKYYNDCSTRAWFMGGF